MNSSIGALLDETLEAQQEYLSWFEALGETEGAHKAWIKFSQACRALGNRISSEVGLTFFPDPTLQRNIEDSFPERSDNYDSPHYCVDFIQWALKHRNDF